MGWAGLARNGRGTGVGGESRARQCTRCQRSRDAIPSAYHDRVGAFVVKLLMPLCGFGSEWCEGRREATMRKLAMYVCVGGGMRGGCGGAFDVSTAYDCDLAG